jgi:hypothetical protein
LLLGASISIGFSESAQSADVGDDTAKAAASTLPNIYLDLRTIYTTTPAGTLSIGFSNPSSSAVATLQSLAPLANSPAPPARPSQSRQSAAVDFPLTVDLSDRVSVYGGFSGSASQIAMSDWSTFAVSSWNVGFQADLYQQKGGSIPTITLQSTLTRAVPDSPLATTSLNTILEFSYALNKDETKGLLAGVQEIAIAVDSELAAINPSIVGYVGAYYQWENNWKVTGRAGVQSFGGAQLINLAPFQPYTQPIVRFDLDRMDDNDNRLFGVTAEIAWTPKPATSLRSERRSMRSGIRAFSSESLPRTRSGVETGSREENASTLPLAGK